MQKNGDHGKTIVDGLVPRSPLLELYALLVVVLKPIFAAEHWLCQRLANCADMASPGDPPHFPL